MPPRARFRLLAVILSLVSGARGADGPAAELEAHFDTKVRPFLQTYCIDCHGREKPEADLDLSGIRTMAELVRDGDRWELLQDRLTSEEMPPTEAKRHPSVEVRRETLDWFRAVRAHEILRNAGDPGSVLARRLSNAEYDYSIRDLTGVDIRPAREFPIDPTNIAGFDNSGESLTMSPTLLQKYLQAARTVANHLYLREHGFAFAGHPMLSETDRDKFCVQQIIAFYHAQKTDYADYFHTAWLFRHRAALGQPAATLADVARTQQVSPKYLQTVWSLLAEKPETVGPVVKLQALWNSLPAPRSRDERGVARAGCEQMRDHVVSVRAKIELRFLNLHAGTPGTEWLPFLVWKNEQYAKHRRFYDPAQLQVAGESHKPVPPVRIEGGNRFGPGITPLVINTPGDPDLVVPSGQRARYEAAFARFASVFPDMFYREQRGRNYFQTGRDEGRYLSAGYHNVMGYFRDDQAFYELLLDERQQAQLDTLWRELDFIAFANMRSYVQFAVSGTRGARESFNDNEPSIPFVKNMNDRQIAATPVIRRLEADYLAMVRNHDPIAIGAIRDYFRATDEGIRWVERARLAAEPSHLQSLLDFAGRAYRRPLSDEDRADVLDFYRTGRERQKLDHETALREAVVMVLMSPNFLYRIDLLSAVHNP